MKRSEVVRAVTEAMHGDSFPDERCIQIARALGVAVEPDEPPLLAWQNVELDHSSGSAVLTIRANGIPWLEVRSPMGTALMPTQEAFADRLIAAYNSRGAPPTEPRDYWRPLAMVPQIRHGEETVGRIVVALTPAGAIPARYHSQEGFFYQLEEPCVRLHVTGWKPLPE